MTICFRISTAADEAEGVIAHAATEQIVAFYDCLRTQGQRLNIALIDPYLDKQHCLAHGFEARVCPLSLALLARLFEYDAGVITVIDEAQFRSRRITIFRSDNKARFGLRVSFLSDPGCELDLANANAFALLESLGLPAESIGSVTVDIMRDRVAHPRLRARTYETGLGGYLERLDRLLATAPLDEPARVAWA